MTMERLKQLREDIEGACDLSLSERLRGQHRTAALEAAALMEAFIPVIAVKEEVALRVGENWNFKIQDPKSVTELSGEALITEMRREPEDPPEVELGVHGRPIYFPPIPVRVELVLMFPRLTVRKI